MKKIMYIAPHLSTGGMPQYLLQKAMEFEGHVTIIEYNNVSDDYTVQKLKMKKKFEVFTLEQNKEDLLHIIEQVKPNIISFQENPETFVSDFILDKIYSNRTIDEITFTAHSMAEDFTKIKYRPTYITTVSLWQDELASKSGIKTKYSPYRLEKKTQKRDGFFTQEGKNIICVGLFTPGKNQAELFEIAKELPECNFHFIGNLAINFKEYWEPLLENKPKNCIVWGEKDNLDPFYNNADLVYFPSQWELMPIVMIEAMSYGLPILCYKLPTYKNEFDKKNVSYLNNLNFSQKKTLTSLKSGNEKYSMKQMEDDIDSYEKFFDINDGDVVVDIGANVGLFEIKHHAKAKKIYAIEPSPLFSEKINSYNFPNVEVHKVAISDKNGKVFIDFEENIEDPLFIVNYADGAKTGDGVETETITFKSFIKRNNIEKIDFLKIDCEGSEYDILTESNLEWMKKNCKKVTGEFHLHNSVHKVRVMEVLDMLDENGIDYILTSVDGVIISRAKFNGLLDFYTEILFYFRLDGSKFKSHTRIYFDFNSGPFVEILDTNPESKYKIEFINDENKELLRFAEINANCWTKCFIEYYVKWKILVYKNGQLLHTELFDLEGRDVFIAIESKSLGDMLAWVPYAEEFRKKHKCNVQIATFKNEIFNYPELEFVTNSSNTFATYRIGWFYDGDDINLFKNKIDPKLYPMQATASGILGLPAKEIKPSIFLPKTKVKKTVGLGIHSTAQAKYWNKEGGWQAAVDYINEIGYNPLIISNEPDGYMGNINPIADKLEPMELNRLIGEISSLSLFIGIGSGLSWLAWACNVPVILISGFSDPYTEFSCMRVSAPAGVCSGCFNRRKLDQDDWNWCPDIIDENKKFECTKSINPNLIISKIKQSLII